MTDGARSESAMDEGALVAEVVAPRRPWLGRAVRLVGFVLCVALFGWAVREALSPENRGALSRLRDAPPAWVVALLALSLVSMALNGAAFWTILRPVRRIPLGSTQAINAVATLLGYAMKLGAVARVLLHARRDQLPVLVIGGWFGAVLVSIAAAVGPMTAAALLSPTLGSAWWLAGLAGVAMSSLAIHGVARAFRGERGLARLHRVLDPLAVGPMRRVLRSARFAELHTGITMLGDAQALGATMLLRTLDVAAQAARFGVAAAIVGDGVGAGAGAGVGAGIGAAEAVAVSAGAFVIQIASPFGVLGAREAGTIGLAEALRDAPAGEIAVVALVVTGSEALVLIPSAAIAAVWLLRNPGRGQE